ncbi:MAG TPA: GAF domain-containing protein [Burkholderiaceae bacterium]|nr:GAF domain-containing protein [Burkholderiaceae bacterium]
MIRDSGTGGNWTDTACGRPESQAPLPFPSADGPGRLPVAGGPTVSAAATDSIHPWPLAPVLIATLCGTVLFSIALRDALAVRADWAAALTLAVAALAGLLLARNFNRPLQTLSARAEQLAVRYTGRAVARGRNESENLVASFEAMTDALLAQLERLKGLHLDELQNSLELQRRYALMRLLRDLSTAALECERLDQVLERALEELGGYLDWPIGRVLFTGEAAGERVRRSVWFVTERERFARFITASEDAAADRSAHGLIGRADATGMPHWVTDLARLDGWARRDLAVQSGLKSGFVIPIAADAATPAFIEFFSDHRIEASVEMVELIEAIHTDLWQAGERRRKRTGLEASARPRQDALGAAGP